MSDKNQTIKSQIERLESKVDKLDEKMDSKLDSINETLIRNTTSLEYHIKRTDLLEEAHKAEKEKIEKIEKHVDRINTTAKVAIWIAGAVAGIAAFVKVLIEIGIIK